MVHAVFITKQGIVTRTFHSIDQAQNYANEIKCLAFTIKVKANHKRKKIKL